MAKPFAHYVIIRENISDGVAAAMIVHAAGLAIAAAAEEQRAPSWIDLYEAAAVVLAVKSEAHLNEVIDSLTMGESLSDVALSIFTERGGPHDGQLMAISFLIDEDRRPMLEPMIGKLQLFRGTTC